MVFLPLEEFEEYAWYTAIHCATDWCDLCKDAPATHTQTSLRTTKGGIIFRHIVCDRCLGKNGGHDIFKHEYFPIPLLKLVNV